MEPLTTSNGMTDECGPHCGIQQVGTSTQVGHCRHCHVASFGMESFEDKYEKVTPVDPTTGKIQIPKIRIPKKR